VTVLIGTVSVAWDGVAPERQWTIRTSCGFVNVTSTVLLLPGILKS
jgi:hypothetical protein